MKNDIKKQSINLFLNDQETIWVEKMEKKQEEHKDWLLAAILYFLLIQDYKYTRIINTPLTLN